LLWSLLSFVITLLFVTVAAISNDDKYSGSHTVTFTETRWYERVRRFLPYLPREIPLFATVTISFWGVAQVLAEIGGEQITLGALATPALLTAFVVAAYKAFLKYRAWVPEALASESKATQGIFRHGKCGWQFALAGQVLTERLATSDRTLDRVALGSEFLVPKRLALDDYSRWLQDRPATLQRLVRSVAIQCTSELPAVLASTKSEEQLSEVKSGVSQLAALYRFAADFEVECHSVQPPEPFEELHKMTYGWSEPIRDGIRDFMDILAQLAAIDRKTLRSGKVAVPTFNIEFKSPPNIDDFSRKLDAIDINAMVEAVLCG
jgi:hypothetical protein